MSLDTRNAELDKKLEDNPVDSAIAALTKADQRRKRQVFLLFVSIAFDLVLSFALAYGWRQNHNLAIQAESNRAAIVARCNQTNDARAKNEKLWDYLIEQSKDVPRDPQKQMFYDEFIKLKSETFEQTDCSKVVK